MALGCTPIAHQKIRINFKDFLLHIVEMQHDQFKKITVHQLRQTVIFFVDKPVNSIWITADYIYCFAIPSQGNFKMASACRFARKLKPPHQR